MPNSHASWSPATVRKPCREAPSTAARLGAAIGAVATVVGAGCERSPEPTPAPATAAASALAPTATDEPPAAWQRTCARCHDRDDVRGRTAAQIQAAFETEPRMRPYRRRVTSTDLAELERYLAPAAAPARDGAAPGADDYAYLPAERCAECHPRHVAEWSSSLHALAHTESVYDYYFMKASRDSGQKLETFCANCHTPLGVHQRTIPFAKPPRKPGDTAVSAVAAEGVGCDFCHTLTAPREQQNGGFVLRPSKTKLGPYGDSSSPFHPTEGTDLYRRAEYCAPCHNVTHPDNGIVLESTFSEWKASPYAAEGVSCQDCHMTAGLVRRQTRAGLAAAEGPKREHVSDHFFVGPNVLFARSAASEPLAKLSRELMRRAATLEIGEPAAHEGKLALPIRVTNTGAGHYLPTGVTEIRELWLEVTLLDPSGKPLLHRGAIGPKGELDPEAIVYRTDVADRSGAITTQFWNTVKKVRDYRLPPRQTVTEQLVLPEAVRAAKGTVTAKVALRYRSVTPAGLREVGAPADLVDIPVLTLVEAERALRLP